MVVSVEPVVLAGPSVGRFKQLQMKNHNNNTKEEVVQKPNKPDSTVIMLALWPHSNTAALHYYKISFSSMKTRGR